jgi:hypothetical protein
MLRVFIGYDPRQPVAYNVLQFSLIRRSSRPVAVTPLVIEQLPITRTGLTPFTFSRFLVPQLCNFEGWALFLDLDMLVQGDIAELFDLADENNAVMVVKSGARFEWASVILFNCGHPDNRQLTPDYLETAKGLHGIPWTEKIGSLPPEWNHLVMYDEPKPAKLLHYTAGMPCYPETKELGYADEWMKELKLMTSIAPWAQLMGNSVHARPVMERLERMKQSKPAG